MYGCLRTKDKLGIGPNEDLRTQLLHWSRTSSTRGQSGRDATLKKLQGLFHRKGLTKAIQNFIRNCTVCQACKYNTAASPGLQQPLPIGPIPNAVCQNIKIDFIEGFAKVLRQTSDICGSRSFDQMCPPYCPYSSLYCSRSCQAFLDNVFKHHG